MTVANYLPTDKIIVEKIDVEVTKTIFHWHSPVEIENVSLSPNCHCLLRIFLLDDGKQAVVVASSLYSNKGNAPLSEDSYSHLIETALNRFSKLIPLVNLRETTANQHVTWLGHWGQFSVPLSWAESLTAETFSTYSFHLDPNTHEIEVRELEDITQSEVIDLLKGANLEPVVEVLKQLGHDNNWGFGPVDDLQVKGCLDLEKGIVEGEQRQKGLIGW